MSNYRMSLFRVHAISNYPSHFIDDRHVLIQSGSILSCLSLETGQQTFVLALTEFGSISCIASNPSSRIFVIAIQSATTSRIQLYNFSSIDDIKLFRVFAGCSDAGYSHIDLSRDGQHMIAISNIPDLQIEFWSVASQKKLAATSVPSDDTQFAQFSPTSHELFMTANQHTIILWRVYFKFDQYFLTSTVHSLTNQRRLSTVTFGEGGTEVVYCNNYGEMVVFNEATAAHDAAMLVAHKLNANLAIFALLFTRYHYIVVHAEDGIIEFISKASLQKVYEYHVSSSIKHCLLAPNYRELLLIDEEYQLLRCFLDAQLLAESHDVVLDDPNLIKQREVCRFSQIEPNPGFNIISLQRTDSILLHIENLQLLRFPNVGDEDRPLQNLDFPIFNVSTMAVCHYDDEVDLIAFGFNDGNVGLCHVEQHADMVNLKLFFAERLFQNNVHQVAFDMRGSLVACISNDSDKVWFLHLAHDAAPHILGYYQLTAVPLCCCWVSDAYSTLKLIIAFGNGLVATYDAPKLPSDSDSDAEDDSDGDTLLLASHCVDCEVDFSLLKMVRDPNETAPDKLLCLTEDNKLKAFLLDDDATVFPDDTFVFDDHMKRVTDLRVQGDLLLTASEDGLLIIRYMSDPTKILLSVYAHDSSARGRGVLCAEFVTSGAKILSVGHDGSVISWELEEDIQFENEVAVGPCPLSSGFLDNADEVMIDEDNVLTYSETRRSQLVAQRKQQFQPVLRGIKEELLTLRANYEEITAKVAKASDIERLEESELIVDTAQCNALLGDNEVELAKVAERIKDDNIGAQLITRRIKAQCWDAMTEKLQMVRGLKDTSRTVTTFPMVAHSKEEIALHRRLQFLRKMSLTEQEWSRKTQERVRVELDVTQCVKNRGIAYIWDINEGISAADDIKEHQQKPKDTKDAKSEEKSDEKKEDEQGKKTEVKKEEPKEALATSDRVKFPVSAQLKHLLYHPLRLYTNYSKRMQMHLLNLRIRELKSALNREVGVIFKLKRAEIERINEMALEITDIQKELGPEHSEGADSVFVAKLGDDEDKQRMFTVADSEIRVEKVLTEAELAARAEMEAARRKREDGADNSVTTRALTEMMNNTLESKDEVERLQDTLKKPEFMDSVPESSWSEEQRAAVAVFVDKAAELAKAQEVRTKLLRTRLKSLKNEVAEICRRFDEKLAALYAVRLCVMEDIYVHELMLIHLGNDIVELEQHSARIANMNLELARLREDKHKADKTHAQFDAKLEESKKRLEELHAHDKLLEKTAKKELSSMPGVGEFADYLLKLFRGKKAVPPKHVTQAASNTTTQGGSGLDRRPSYSTQQSMSVAGDSHSDLSSMKSQSKMSLKQEQQDQPQQGVGSLMQQLKEDEFEDAEQRALEEERRRLDPYFVEQPETAADQLRHLTKPMELPQSVWSRLLELRRLKMASDSEIAKLSHCIASMQAEVNALRSNQRIILESIEDIGRARQLLIVRRDKFALDCELFFCSEQGAVEVEESPVVTDMRQSVMCERGVIQKLNRVILDAGAEQIARLHEIKAFRRGINLLNWRAKVLDLEHRYYTLLTTEYQLRRVTKQDQETIKAGGHDSKQKNEVSSLERKLEFTKSTMDAKLKEKKKMLKKHKSRSAEMTKANRELTKQIAKLESDVSSKQEIVNIRGTISVKDEKKLSVQKKMDAVVTRRKLVDLVKAQSEEIEFLRNELDRLRRRTFPSFAIAESRTHP